MVLRLTLEDELELEKECRQAACDHGPRMAALLRSCHLQRQLLQQAVNEIARLELLLMDRQNGTSSSAGD